MNAISRLINLARKNVEQGFGKLFDFDRWHGTDTKGVIPLDKLDVAGDGEFVFQSTPRWVLREVMKVCPIGVNEYSFVDFGSGKGKALLLASHYPFKTVIGVEFSPQLHQTALANVSTYRAWGQQCRDIRPLCVDAAQFPIPQDKTLFYIYNPFGAEIMEAIIRNIEKSLRESPRRIYIVYYNPVFRSLFDEAGFLTLLAFKQFYRFASRRPRGRFAVYSNVPD